MNATVERESIAKNRAIDAANEADGKITWALDVAYILHEAIESDAEFVNKTSRDGYFSDRLPRYANTLFLVWSYIKDALKEMIDEIDSIEYGLEAE